MAWYDGLQQNIPDVEADQNAERMVDALMRRQVRAAAVANQEAFNQIWSEALQESGLSQAEYNQLAASDVERTKKAVKRGMSKAISKVAQGRQSQTRQQPVAKSSSVDEAESRRARLREVREAHGTASDDALDAMLNEMLPSSDPFTRYGR